MGAPPSEIVKMEPNRPGLFGDNGDSSPLSSCCSDPGGLEGPRTDLPRYCICRGFDEGMMIGCDGGCDDWFHIRCVGITEKEQDLIETYICSQCTESGKGQTIWRPGVARAVPKPATSSLLAGEALLKLSEETTIREKEAAVRKAIREANGQPGNREATKEVEKAKRAVIIRDTARNARLAVRRARISRALSTSPATPLKSILKKPSFKPQTRHIDGGGLVTAAVLKSILEKPTPQVSFDDDDMDLVFNHSKSRASAPSPGPMAKKKPQTRYSDGGTQLRSSIVRSKIKSTRSKYRDLDDDAQTPTNMAVDDLSPERMPSDKQTPPFVDENESADSEKKEEAEQIDLEDMEQTYVYKLVKKAMQDALFGNWEGCVDPRLCQGHFGKKTLATGTELLD